MEFLDRYVQAIKAHLPIAQQDDIVQEITANILAEVEGEEAKLGRPLKESEQEAVLKRHGHPMLVGSRYRKLPLSCLIGPESFPLYCQVLRIVLPLVALANVVVGGISILCSAKWVNAFFTVWGVFWLSEIAVFGLVTAVFGWQEYFHTRFRFLEDWSPRFLPQVRRDRPEDSRRQAITELVLGGVGTLAWLIMLHYPFSTSIPTMKITPVWYAFELPMLLTALLGMAAVSIDAFRFERPNVRRVLRLLSNGIGVVTCILFVQADEFVVILDRTTGSEVVKIFEFSFTVAELANYSVALGVVFFGVCFALNELGAIRQWFRRQASRAVSTSSSANCIS